MQSSSNTSFIEVSQITYTHWNHTEPTLIDVSFQIQTGTLNVLVGPGGSGKTTLCDILNGKIPHLLGGDLEGDVRIDGANTRSVEVKDLAQKVGYVFQDPETMFATLYVDDEIAFGPENLRIAADDIRADVDRLLDLTQLAPFRGNLVWNLSGGQVQKLGLAVILAMQPRLIILDEPTSNLDPAATLAVHNLILGLRDQGMTVLLVTRELDEFLARADQLLVLDHGCLLTAGSPRDVLREYGSHLLNILGIWLPETSEIGIALQARGYSVPVIPISVVETCELLQDLHLLEKGLEGAGPIEAQTGNAQDVLVKADHLTYGYGGGRLALKDVSIQIRAGEMLCIVGRNGAGKSTLAKLFSGLLKPRGGELTLFGRPAKKWKVQDLANQVALVFQNPEHQFLTDTVWDEVAYSLTAHGVSDPKEMEAQVCSTLALLGLEGFEKTHPFALSAGMKRRLGVATMLVGKPCMLLVDEPTYGQDRQMTVTLMSLMEQIRAQGIAVVMITHDMRLVQEYAQRVVVMSEGEVLYDGEPAGLFDRPSLLEAANLRLTLLNSIVNQVRDSGVSIKGRFSNTQSFLHALNLQAPPEAPHGSC